MVLPILFGAAFTVAISIAMGSLLLRRLRVTLHRLEAVLFAFVGGSACLSLATFLLCLVHQATGPVFLSGGLAVILWAAWDARGKPRRMPLPSMPPVWAGLFSLILTAFFLAYFFNALAPEVSADGSGYHLGNVARYWRHHGFVWDYHSLRSYFSQGAEMLFLVAFSFGGHSAAALVHFAFLTALPLLMVCYGRRFAFPRAAGFAAVLAYTCPVAGLAGSSAYNDLAVATVLFAVFYSLQVWDETNDSKLLILVGLLSGFAYALKYTAFLALPFAISCVYRRIRDRRLLLLPLSAVLMIAPWTIRNWIWVGNPFAPFMNRWFPNPYVHPGVEQSLGDLGRYEGIHHFWEVPLQLTLHGSLIPGMVGPVFLLAPLALLALRSPHGRRLLAAALVFAIPAYFNTAARFLLPAIPFLSLAMGIALANSWGILPALAMFEALVCWPPVLALYCDPVSWRIRHIPVRAALRLEPESQFLREHIPDYWLREPIEREVAPAEKIFSFTTRPEAYIEQPIMVSYESTLGNLANEILLTPIYYPPLVRRRFRFEAQNTRGIRVVEQASAEAYWSIAEMRLLSQGREVQGSPSWHFTAWPNRWEAYLAFDGSAVTRWSSWQPMSPGSRLQVDFGREERIDEVVLEGPVDAAQVTVEISTGGRWMPLGRGPEVTRMEPSTDLRMAATRELKGRGIRYLLINDSDSTGADMKQNTSQWGITRLAEANGTVLYRVD